MVSEQKISVEVAYALPEKQMIIPLRVVDGTTVYDAVVQSGITEHFEGLDLDNEKMGVWSKAVKDPKVEVLKAGDRVEIYRSLLIDPKEMRLRRAEKAKQAQQEASDADEESD